MEFKRVSSLEMISPAMLWTMAKFTAGICGQEQALYHSESQQTLTLVELSLFRLALGGERLVVTQA